MCVLAFCDLCPWLAVVAGPSEQKKIDFDINLIKSIRLCRLARLVRLLRFKVFYELKMMIQGVFAGLRVLSWAVVLLFFFVYALGVAIRMTIGSGAPGRYETE